MVQMIAFALFVHVAVGFVALMFEGGTPIVTTTLSSAMTSSSTTATVTSTDGFTSEGTIFIDGEAIDYTSLTATTFDGLTRAQEQTDAIAHASGAIVYNDLYGIQNQLSNFESRTAVDDLGTLGSPWTNPISLVQFLARAVSWDYDFFEGPFAILRVFGVILTVPILWGVFVVMASVVGGILSVFRGAA